jgi:uncharacterized protein with FMN-binding domain
MLRTTTRTAAAALLAGVSITLAGCAAGAEAEPSPTATTEATETAEAAPETVPEATAETEAGVYADGTYTSSGSYQTPNGTESVEVTVTVDDDTVTAVTVVGSASGGESAQYQGMFIDGISAAVVGQPLEGLSVSRVSGSSLTSGGFNAALEQIRAAAA